MGMGNFDEREYERREKKLSEIGADSEAQPAEFQGEVTVESDQSTESLLDRLEQIRSEQKEASDSETQ